MPSSLIQLVSLRSACEPHPSSLSHSPISAPITPLSSPAQLDTDYSGELDRAEFKRFLENININTTFGVFNQVFDLLDRDRSGFVEYREFMAAFG